MLSRIFIHACLFTLLSSKSLIAQNLVTNGSFEDIRHCPPSITTIHMKIPLQHWYSPSAGTPDLFHRCSIDETNAIPNNFMGQSEPVDGNAYVGLCLYKTPAADYREYLAVKLIGPLTTGESYMFSFYYKLAQFSKIAVDNFQVYLLHDSIGSKSDRVLRVAHAEQQFLIRGDADAMGDGWQFYETTFTATGNERYLLFGNTTPAQDVAFSTVQVASRLANPVRETVSYYYFDTFILRSLAKPLFKTDSVFHLEKVYFDFDQSLVKTESYEDLKQLSEFLLKHSDLSLIIYGHADKKGSAEYNRLLSARRAEAIKNTLIQYGVPPVRLKTQAVGNNELVSTDDSKNRRVEFQLIK